MSKLMFSILLTPLIQLQNASQCGGVTQVALHQLVEVSGPGVGNGKIDADAVVFAHYLFVLPDVAVFLQTVDGQVQRIEGDIPSTALLNGAHHLVGVHRFLAQKMKHHHFGGGFFQRDLNVCGAPTGFFFSCHVTYHTTL